MYVSPFTPYLDTDKLIADSESLPIGHGFRDQCVGHSTEETA